MERPELVGRAFCLLTILIMNSDTTKQILQRIDLKRKRVFHYFRDMYALALLGRALPPEGESLRSLRKSRFAPLLDRPPVRRVLGTIGRGVLTPNDCLSYWDKSAEAYRLTVGTWGSDEPKIPHPQFDSSCTFLSLKRSDFQEYFQTSRSGINLVLQMNFSSKHDRVYRKLIQPSTPEGPFQYVNHPIAGKGLSTLAWSRIDLDRSTGEALIEEIQSDWLRLVHYEKIVVEMIEESPDGSLRVVQQDAIEQDRGHGASPETMAKYLKYAIRPHLRIWNEAVLLATISFLREELGIRKIYYHSFDTGNKLKRIAGFEVLPPRSLYSDLPAKFCFSRTSQPPTFLRNHLMEQTGKLAWTKDDYFYLLDLSRGPPGRQENVPEVSYLSPFMKTIDKHGWKQALGQPSFRTRSLLTLIFLFATLTSLRFLLDSIESRAGTILDDPILALVDPVDLTWPIFGMIYGGVVIVLISLLPHPPLLVQTIQMYVVMVLIRILCLYVVPLDPPITTIPLRDPIVEFFGSTDIVLTKDLFFSGHTATLFLFALAAPDRHWRFLLFGISASVALAVLLQHVHYTIDVLVAPLVSFAAFSLVRSITRV